MYDDGFFGWLPNQLRIQLYLVLLIFSWEQRLPQVEFSNHTPEAPHIDLWSIVGPQDNLGGPIESRLDVGEKLFAYVTRGTHIHQLNSCFLFIHQEYIFWLNITMNNSFNIYYFNILIYPHKVKGYEYLNTELLNGLHF